MPDLFILKGTSATPMKSQLYDPVVCLVLQGRKVAMTHDQRVQLGPGELLLVSHTVPVQARITQATPQTPYLALIFQLDLQILRSLYDEMGPQNDAGVVAGAFAKCSVRGPIVDAFARCLDLADDEVAARVLAAGLRRELHFHLLRAPCGHMLRQLLQHDTHASRVAQAIAHIRQGYRSPLSVRDVADHVGMSVSSFHKHFRAVTSTTPLQFQKALRLLEAQRLLRDGEHNVSDTAYAVGYESPTQFSREYTRHFGIAPSRDRGANGA